MGRVRWKSTWAWMGPGLELSLQTQSSSDPAKNEGGEALLASAQKNLFWPCLCFLTHTVFRQRLHTCWPAPRFFTRHMRTLRFACFLLNFWLAVSCPYSTITESFGGFLFVFLVVVVTIVFGCCCTHESEASGMPSIWSEAKGQLQSRKILKHEAKWKFHSNFVVLTC